MSEEITNVINKLKKPENFNYYTNYGYAHSLLITDADTIIDYFEETQQLKAIEKEHQKINGELREENERLQEQKDFWRKEFVDNKEQLDLYKEVIEEVRELIPKQLLSNVNITKYTDEMCLRDIYKILDKAKGSDK